MFLRVKKTSSRHYLQIVESYRDQGRVRQRVIATIGRIEELSERGQIEQLLRSLAKYSQRAILLLAGVSDPQAKIKKVGPGMVFGRLWERIGIGEHICKLLQGRRYRFEVERTIFATVLHRLMNPGSDRQAERWLKAYRIDKAGNLQLQHFYRAMAWLGSPLKDTAAAEGFSPRCVKDEIEERVFTRRRNLFTGLDLVFFDTTSLYFEGDGGESIGQYGYSKDQRPDLKQMIAGVVLDSEGYPLCCELWPGNTADVKSLKVVAGRLKGRFGIERMCVVADRGMISKETIAQLEGEKIHYILGVRMRRKADIAPQLLDDARYDGKWVLTTDTDLPAKDVALKYKQLLMVERIFRDMKSVLETRPIFHKCDETIRGHVFCSFLALVLRKELEQALERTGERFEWEDIKRDIKSLQEMTIKDNGKEITVRSRAEGCCGKVFQAVGVALPPSIRMP